MTTPAKTAAAAAASAPGSQVPVPEGMTTEGTVEVARVRRVTPPVAAARYDGTNALQVAGWLLGQGRSCQIALQPGRLPELRNADGTTAVARGWVLPTLEVVPEQEMGTTFEIVPE